MNRKTMIAVLASVIVAAGVIVGVLIAVNAASQPRDPFWACMAERGYSQDEPLSESGHTMDEFRADGEACAELTGSNGVPEP